MCSCGQSFWFLSDHGGGSVKTRVFGSSVSRGGGGGVAPVEST